MKIIHKSSELQSLLQTDRSKDKSVGFVPTMGALHQGHLRLIEKASRENDICVVSIFVNPTQFNDAKDLEKYPRTLEKDIKLLTPLNVDYIFTPDIEEIYPTEDTRLFEFGRLDKVMEGKHRPGHFNGVAQVVSKLFNIVEPTKAYFGEKDFQQLTIIKELVNQLQYHTQIIPVSIVRETSGLALSSRNERLSDKQKEIAPILYKELCFAKLLFDQGKDIDYIINKITDNINSEKEFKIEYFDIVDGKTLEHTSTANNDFIVACIAVYCGDIRLIDNIILKQKSC